MFLLIITHSVMYHFHSFIQGQWRTHQYVLPSCIT